MVAVENILLLLIVTDVFSFVPRFVLIITTPFAASKEKAFYLPILLNFPNKTTYNNCFLF
jgi:hypothetical protein